jgi:hypothetical protein
VSLAAHHLVAPAKRGAPLVRGSFGESDKARLQLAAGRRGQPWRLAPGEEVEQAPRPAWPKRTTRRAVALLQLGNGLRGYHPHSPETAARDITRDEQLPNARLADAEPLGRVPDGDLQRADLLT